MFIFLQFLENCCTFDQLSCRFCSQWLSVSSNGRRESYVFSVNEFYSYFFFCHSCPQFLITTGENLDYLDGVHTVFGEVSEGLDVLAKVNETFVDKDFIPLQDVRLVRQSVSGRTAGTGCDRTAFNITLVSLQDKSHRHPGRSF